MATPSAGNGGAEAGQQSGRGHSGVEALSARVLPAPGKAKRLHRKIVSPMNPNARLTILFDCCHSGSACELPYVYRPDENGNINLVDTVKEGIALFNQASHLVTEGFTNNTLRDASSFFGRVIPGYIADSFGHYHLLIIFSLLSGVIGFVWTTATSLGGLIVWSLAYGFTSGVSIDPQPLPVSFSTQYRFVSPWLLTDTCIRLSWLSKTRVLAS